MDTTARNHAKRDGKPSMRGLGYEAREGARGGDAVRTANCQLVESSGGEKIGFGGDGSARDSSKFEAKVDRVNKSADTVTFKEVFEKA